MKRSSSQSEGRAILLKMRETQSLSYFSRKIKYDRSTLSKMALGKRPISKKVLEALQDRHIGRQTVITGLTRRGMSEEKARRLARLKAKSLKEFTSEYTKHNIILHKQAKFFHNSLRAQALIARRAEEKYGRAIDVPKDYWKKKHLKKKYMKPIDLTEERERIFHKFEENMKAGRLTKEEAKAAEKAVRMITVSKRSTAKKSKKKTLYTRRNR